MRLDFTVALVAISVLFSCGPNLTEEHESKSEFVKTAADIMYDTPNRSILFRWNDWPVSYSVLGEPNQTQLIAITRAVREINSIARRQILVESLPNDGNSQKISLVISKVEHRNFEHYYAIQFLERFGEAEFISWSKIGGFEFEFNPTSPCFSFSIPNEAKFFDSSFIGKRRPDITFVEIGEGHKISDEMFYSCLLEELAHAAFFIPDWEVSNANESIFNSNMIADDRIDFSDFDKKLIRLLSHPSMKDGLPRSTFVNVAQDAQTDE